MKCPGCFANLSDLRDVCPKCKKDLRDYKKTLGLAITYPQLTYRAILDKYGISQQKGTDQKNPTFLGSLSNFFGDLLVSHPTEIETADKLEEISQDLNEISEIPTPSPEVETSCQVNPTSRLFRQARAEVSQQPSSNEIDLTSARSFIGEAQQKVILMFGLARDELNGVRRQESDKPLLSSERTLESEALSSRLKEVETVYEQTTASSGRLKDLASKNQIADRAAAMETDATGSTPNALGPSHLLPAPIWRRLAAYFTDVIVAQTLTALALAGYDAWYSLGILDAIISQSYEATTVDLDTVAFTILIAPPIGLLLYFFFSYLLFRGSSGESLFSVDIRKSNGRVASNSQLLFRALFLVLNLTFLPIFPILFLGRSFSDLISGTQAYLSPKS